MKFLSILLITIPFSLQATISNTDEINQALIQAEIDSLQLFENNRGIFNPYLGFNPPNSAVEASYLNQVFQSLYSYHNLTYTSLVAGDEVKSSDFNNRFNEIKNNLLNPIPINCQYHYKNNWIGDGLYTVNIRGVDTSVYCAEFENQGWMRVDNNTNTFTIGAECNGGSVASDGTFSVRSINNGGTGRTTHGGCGISSREALEFKKIRIENMTAPTTVINGGTTFPAPRFEIHSDNDGPRNTYNGSATFYPGHRYLSADNQTNRVYLQEVASGGRYLNTPISLTEEKDDYHIHFAVRSFSGSQNQLVTAKIYVYTEYNIDPSSCQDAKDRGIRNNSGNYESGLFNIDGDQDTRTATIETFCDFSLLN